MIIDATSLAYIQGVIRTAGLVKIDNIVINPTKIWAVDSDRTVVISHEKDIPAMSFGAICINRINIFSDRLEIAKSVDNFSVEVVLGNTSAQEPFARSLIMKGKGIKIDYRCANPQTIRVPTAFHDHAVYRVKITPEAIALILKGQSAMSTDEVTFVGTDDGVSFEMSDINSDTLAYHFADDIETIGDNVSTFKHRYPSKTLHTLFKANTDGYFQITSKGMMKIIVNNLDVYVLARE